MGTIHQKWLVTTVWLSYYENRRLKQPPENMRLEEYSKPGFEPGTKHLVRVPLYPVELLSRCKGTIFL